MSDTTVGINKNIHAKLQAISEKRKAALNPASNQKEILHELILKLHKKECE